MPTFASIDFIRSAKGYVTVYAPTLDVCSGKVSFSVPAAWRSFFELAGSNLNDGSEFSAPIFDGSQQVGVVTTASYSRLLMQSLAMVHLKPTHLKLGTSLTVRSQSGDFKATVVRTPFYDPRRLRTHPEKLA